MHGLSHWSDWVRDREEAGDAYALVTLLGARGSTPRDSGTKMVVHGSGINGTIGGGELEFRVTARARELLLEGSEGQWLENYPLGEKLGQCCGGSTSVLIECFVPQVPELHVFGAGHVGQALIPLLGSLPLRVNWYDERPDTLPAETPANVHCREGIDLLAAIDGASSHAYYLVMTHNHPLDYALMERALARGDSAYIGVIGSDSKARRFRLRLAHRGYEEAAIASIHCPVGLREIPGKRPAEIAVSVAAQLIAHYHALADAASAAPIGPPWRDLKATAAALAADDADANNTIDETP